MSSADVEIPIDIAEALAASCEFSPSIGIRPGKHWRRLRPSGSCDHLRIAGGKAWIHRDDHDPRVRPLSHTVEVFGGAMSIFNIAVGAVLGAAGAWGSGVASPLAGAVAGGAAGHFLGPADDAAGRGKRRGKKGRKGRGGRPTAGNHGAGWDDGGGYVTPTSPYQEPAPFQAPGPIHYPTPTYGRPMSPPPDLDFRANHVDPWADVDPPDLDFSVNHVDPWDRG